MRARTLILLFFAIVLAAGTAMLARSWLAAQRSEIVAAAPTVTPVRAQKSVLVARADITRGQILKPEDLAWQPWPDTAVNGAYIVSGGGQEPKSFAGSVAVNPIATGEPITKTKVIAPGDRGFLAAVLRPGMRAISVPVTVTSGISGFVFPGDRVDLLVTYPVPTPPGAVGAAYQNRVTETVLSNVRVIGVDQELQSKPGSAVVARTATFEVTPKQSEAITLANEIGKLSLSLRSLVPTAHETSTAAASTSGGGDKLVDPPSENAGDSSIAHSATYTLDSEISHLLPGNSTAGTITILRGSTKSSETINQLRSDGDQAAAPGDMRPSPDPSAARSGMAGGREPTQSAGGT